MLTSDSPASHIERQVQITSSASCLDLSAAEGPVISQIFSMWARSALPRNSTVFSPFCISSSRRKVQHYP